MDLWIDKNGNPYSGDMQNGDREATTEEINRHINGMPVDWLYRLNLEFNQKIAEFRECLGDDLIDGMTLKESQSYAASQKAEAIEDYELKLAKIKNGTNPFEGE